jgi:hypothetical protein
MPVHPSGRLFSKPSHDRPTCHLLVGNCGPAVGITVEQVIAAFSPFGPCTLTASAPDRPFLFVTYESPEEAAAAKQALDAHLVGSRRVSIQYSEARKQVHEPAPLFMRACMHYSYIVLIAMWLCMCISR